LDDNLRRRQVSPVDRCGLSWSAVLIVSCQPNEDTGCYDVCS